VEQKQKMVEGVYALGIFEISLCNYYKAWNSTKF
jgi:hypothetical protein